MKCVYAIALFFAIASQAQSTTQPAATVATQPTAADYSLQLALRDAINANYRLTFKQGDSNYDPQETEDDLTSRRDATADALAKLLPATFGRQGVLQLFTPGTVGAELPQWQVIRGLFSQPDHWFLQATTVPIIPLFSNPSANVVQVVFGEINSRSHREIVVGTHKRALDILLLNEGATGKARSYLAKLPPTAEMISTNTAIVHADRLDHLVTVWQRDYANLATVDFSTRESNVRTYFASDYKGALTGISGLTSLRLAQSLPHETAALREEVESGVLLEDAAAFDAALDADLFYAVSHSGASTAERLRLISDRTALIVIAQSHQPLSGIYDLTHTAALSYPAAGTAPGPSLLLTQYILAPLSQKIAALPSVASAIAAAAPSPTLSKTEVNLEALLQAWHAPPAALNQIAKSLLDDEYSRTLVTTLVAGARGGVVLDQARVDAIVAKAQKLSPGSDALQLQIGALYYYLHRDPLAEKVFTALDNTSTDPEVQSTGLQWLAYIKLRANDLPSALDCLQLSAQLAPKDAMRQYFYASELDKAGQTSKAIEAYGRFLALEPATPRALAVKKRIAELQQNTAATPQPSEPGL